MINITFLEENYQHYSISQQSFSPTSGTSGRLQNRASVPPWFLHSDCV